MEEKIFKEIQKIIKSKFNKKVEINTKLDEIGLDSLDLLDLIVDAEAQHGIKIEDSELLEIKTIEDVVKSISSKIK